MAAGYGRSDNVRPVKPGAPSVTAQKVALQRLSFDRVPVPYGNADADLALARDVAANATVDGDSPLSEYLAARTAFFDRVVVSALDRGVTQAIIVGAGYDGRALRYAKPGVRWFELDHPATQTDKRERLDRLGVDTEGITYVAADFGTDDVELALTAASFDRALAAIFICEGVAVYLDRPVLVSLLRSIRAVAAERSLLAISLSMAADSDEAEARQAWFRARVAAVGEPERDRLTAEDKANVLHDTGWKDETTSPRAQRAGLVVLSPA
jgi:methyltransferase (TIGR00027 family)